jgi:hypothetical protein
VTTQKRQLFLFDISKGAAREVTAFRYDSMDKVWHYDSDKYFGRLGDTLFPTKADALRHGIRGCEQKITRFTTMKERLECELQQETAG